MTIIELSVLIHFINDLDNKISTTRTKNEIPHLFEQINHIWEPARIKFIPTILPRENIVNNELAKLMDIFFTTSLDPGYDKIDIYFVSNVTYNQQMINGWTNRKLRRVFINDYLNVDFSKCVAHEIGHTLQLGHVSNPDNLMAEFTNGKNLSESEIEIARNNAAF